jgi:hypothetical protein
MLQHRKGLGHLLAADHIHDHARLSRRNPDEPKYGPSLSHALPHFQILPPHPIRIITRFPEVII